jgi:hypothetical protein
VDFFGLGLMKDAISGWMVVMGVTLRGEDSGTSVVFTGEVVIGD